MTRSENDRSVSPIMDRDGRSATETDERGTTAEPIEHHHALTISTRPADECDHLLGGVLIRDAQRFAVDLDVDGHVSLSLHMVGPDALYIERRDRRVEGPFDAEQIDAAVDAAANLTADGKAVWR